MRTPWWLAVAILAIAAPASAQNEPLRVLARDLSELRAEVGRLHELGYLT
ncbi:MAG: hypothetical protein KC619_17450 [Myxococcales bacterium]|nr:hypothetical protein [Myxococcales bacterium]